jgi:glutathione synthase/RimK-type ligase-like ATP-grasp enzyme
MTRAIVLVPASDFDHAWDWAYDVEAQALERGGFTVEPRRWTEVGDLSDADVVLPLVAWGYHFDAPRWHALLDRLEAERIPTLNPVPVLRWNSDKVYLTTLGAQGVTTVPTIACDVLDDDTLDAARAAFGDDLVVKPPVSAAADGTYRLGAGDPVPDEAIGQPMMIQPFLASVATEGEYSILMFGGAFSHALVKRPKTGDYRVQPHLGGSETACEPPEGAIDLAKRALAAAPAVPAYARVDMIRLNDGRLAVIELELIEPSLWLNLSPDRGASFTAAIAGALEQPLA